MVCFKMEKTSQEVGELEVRQLPYVFVGDFK